MRGNKRARELRSVRVRVPSLVSLGLSWLLAGRAAALPPVQLQAAVSPQGSMVLSARAYDTVAARAWLGLRVVAMGGAVGAPSARVRSREFDARVTCPLGLSLTLAPPRSGAQAFARSGMYVRPQRAGLATGPWLGLGIAYRNVFEDGRHVRLGVDAWRLYGGRGGRFVAPFLSYSF